MSGADGVGREGKGNDIWNLPVEVMEQAIVPLLDPISLLRFGSSCKAARQLSLKKELWEALLLRYNVPSPLPSNSNNNEEQGEEEERAVGQLRDAFVERVTSFSGVYYLSERANDNRCNRGSVHFLALAQGEGGSSGSGLAAYQNTFHNDYGGGSTTKYFGMFRVVKDSLPLDDGTMLVLPHSHLELEFSVQIQSEEGYTAFTLSAADTVTLKLYCNAEKILISERYNHRFEGASCCNGKQNKSFLFFTDQARTVAALFKRR